MKQAQIRFITNCQFRSGRSQYIHNRFWWPRYSIYGCCVASFLRVCLRHHFCRKSAYYRVVASITRTYYCDGACVRQCVCIPTWILDVSTKVPWRVPLRIKIANAINLYLMVGHVNTNLFTSSSTQHVFNTNCVFLDGSIPVGVVNLGATVRTYSKRSNLLSHLENTFAKVAIHSELVLH